MTDIDAARTVLAVLLALIGYWLFGTVGAVIGGIAGALLAGPLFRRLTHDPGGAGGV